LSYTPISVSGIGSQVPESNLPPNSDIR